MPLTGLDLSGMQFGRLTVVSRSGTKSNQCMWTCTCNCGATKIVSGAALKCGATRSCGCLLREMYAAHPAKKHGMTGSRPYRIWSLMKSRCNKEKNPDYDRYGGRGIKVCERWQHSFENFWSDMAAGYSDKLEIDRIDNDGPYSPGNCKWSTRKEQTSNTSRNHWLTFNGQTKTLMQWCEALGLRYGKALRRLYRGKPVEYILCK